MVTKTRALPWVAWLLAASAAVAQTTWTVDVLDDENDSTCVPGDCSLREAIAGAGALDTIDFGLSGSPPWTLRLASPLTVATPIAVSGPGSDQVRISGDTNGDATPDVRVFVVEATGTLVLSHLAVENGISPAGATRNGGCVRNLGVLTLDSVEITGCRGWSGSPTTLNGNAGASGGAIWNGAGATLSIFSSRLAANVAGGGASSADGLSAGPEGGSGGALANAGTATVHDSTFEGNHAGRGGYPYGRGGDGGAVANLAGGVLRLVGSTLVSNASGDETCNTGTSFADGRGGGIFSAGESAVENSTLSGNQIGDTVVCSSQSARGGGLAVVGGTTRLRNATVADNSASGNGGGIAREGGVLRLRNSLVALNTSTGSTQEDCTTTDAASLVSEGYNVVQRATGCAASLVGSGDVVDTGATPLIGPLGDGGGPTSTHPLADASPAIDAGDPAGCVGWDPASAMDTAMPTDQRGEPRPTDGDGDTVATCDAGAFEAPELVLVFHDLDVSLAGAGSGSVTSGDGLIDCPSDCSESYLEDSSVELTAAAEIGSLFVGWSGSCTGTATCQLTMDMAHSVTATFEPTPTWTLTVSLGGDGAGSVTSGDGLIDCPGDCSETYLDATAVVLTAAAATGSLFVGWSGDCAGGATECGLAMTADHAVTAFFVLEQIFSDGFEQGDVCAWSAATGAPPCFR